jgi:hypothetical protein
VRSAAGSPLANCADFSIKSAFAGENVGKTRAARKSDEGFLAKFPNSTHLAAPVGDGWTAQHIGIAPWPNLAALFSLTLLLTRSIFR